MFRNFSLLDLVPPNKNPYPPRPPSRKKNFVGFRASMVPHLSSAMAENPETFPCMAMHVSRHVAVCEAPGALTGMSGS